MLNSEPLSFEPELVRPLKRSEYDRMVELGLFHDERVELIRGVLVKIPPQRAPHASTVQQLTDLLSARLQKRFTLRIQSAIPVALTFHVQELLRRHARRKVSVDLRWETVEVRWRDVIRYGHRMRRQESRRDGMQEPDNHVRLRTCQGAKRPIRCRHDGTMHGLPAARYFSHPRRHNRGFTLEASIADNVRCNTSEDSLSLR